MRRRVGRLQASGEQFVLLFQVALPELPGGVRVDPCPQLFLFVLGRRGHVADHLEAVVSEVMAAPVHDQPAHSPPRVRRLYLVAGASCRLVAQRGERAGRRGAWLMVADDRVRAVPVLRNSADGEQVNPL